MRFELFIAQRYLRAKRKQAFISVIAFFSVAGVALGVASLIIAMSIMNGFTIDLRDKIIGANPHISVESRFGPLSGYTEEANQIAGVPGVTGVTPYIYSACMASNRNGAKGLMLRGIDPESAADVIEIIRKLSPQSLGALAASTQVGPEWAKGAGNAPGPANAQPQRQSQTAQAGQTGQTGQTEQTDPAGPVGQPGPAEQGPGIPGIIVGKELARQLVLQEGSRVYLLSPSGERSSAGFSPSTKTFKVVGIFETGMYHFDLGLAFISLPAARDLLGLPAGYISGLEASVEDVYTADKVAKKIEGVLGQNYVARPWMEQYSNLFAALKLEKLAMGIVLTLITLVATFSIAATLVMLVMEKTKDIAVLMSMGATSGMIRRIFILQGSLIGVIGTAIGAALGLAGNFILRHYPIDLPPGVYSTNHVPIVMQGADIIMICGGAILLCFIATLYPASKAAGLKPVEALHYE